MKDKIIVKNAVERKPYTFYYIDGDGNLCQAKIHKTKHSQKTSKKKEKVIMTGCPEEMEDLFGKDS